MGMKGKTMFFLGSLISNDTHSLMFASITFSLFSTEITRVLTCVLVNRTLTFYLNFTVASI